MKKIILLSLLSLSIVSCKSTSHTDCDAYGNLQIEDSTKVEGYNESQRALAYYILSLPESEKNKWVKGTFTEEEKNIFLDSVEIRTKN
jgi:hypothetical protein